MIDLLVRVLCATSSGALLFLQPHQAPCSANAVPSADEVASFQVQSTSQPWSIRFDGRGLLVQPDRAQWCWGLELIAYGRGETEFRCDQPSAAAFEPTRVTYVWDSTLEEWYLDGRRGLEHGYTIHRRPIKCSRGEPLWLSLRLVGDLAPVIDKSRRHVRFVDKQGRTLLTYSDLFVFDAEGRALRAWFELGAEGLLLSVADSRAVYPLTVDPIAQQAYVKASTPGAGNLFGRSLAVSGDTLVVGAFFEGSSATGVNGDETNNHAPGAGAAYVFQRNGSTWNQQAYLKASNTDAIDQFGWSVAISGDTLVVGAPREGSSARGVNGNENDNGASLSGAAYVFVRSGSTWAQEAYLKAEQTGPGDAFGTSVALSGSTLVVGASAENGSANGVNGDQTDDGAPDAGAAYVFVRNASTWSQQAYLKASNSDAGDLFGFSVAISGETVLIGALRDDSGASGVNGDASDNSALDSGAAYLFVRSGTTWSQQAFLKASNPDATDEFGRTVALFDDTAVVGAVREDGGSGGSNGNQGDNTLNAAGAAYVFLRSGTNWSQQTYLKPEVPGQLDEFAMALSVFGDTLVVGASGEDSSSIGIGGNALNQGAANSGAVYLFERNGTVWQQVLFLKSSNTDAQDKFGTAVSLFNHTLAVGAPNEDGASSGINGDQCDNSSSSSGAAYLFDLEFDHVFPPVGTDLCSGDGGNQVGCTECPCNNTASLGTVGGCLNSAGSSAWLQGAGDLSVSLSAGALIDLRFSLTSVPPAALCILSSGASVTPTNVLSPCFGLQSGAQAIAFDGLRCAAVDIRRHGIRFASSNGGVGLTTEPWGGEGAPLAGLVGAGNGFIPGQTRYFQAVYRDDPLLVCLRGLNTSQAIEITFTP